MKKILGMLLIAVLSSCVEDSNYVTCPCLVIKVDHIRFLGDKQPSYFRLTFQSIEDNNKSFLMQSNELYEIGDTLKIVKRK